MLESVEAYGAFDWYMRCDGVIWTVYYRDVDGSQDGEVDTTWPDEGPEPLLRDPAREKPYTASMRPNDEFEDAMTQAAM